MLPQLPKGFYYVSHLKATCEAQFCGSRCLQQAAVDRRTERALQAPGLKKKVGGDVNQTFTHARAPHISSRGAHGSGL